MLDQINAIIEAAKDLEITLTYADVESLQGTLWADAVIMAKRASDQGNLKEVAKWSRKANKLAI